MIEEAVCFASSSQSQSKRKPSGRKRLKLLIRAGWKRKSEETRSITPGVSILQNSAFQQDLGSRDSVTYAIVLKSFMLQCRDVISHISPLLLYNLHVEEAVVVLGLVEEARFDRVEVAQRISDIERRPFATNELARPIWVGYLARRLILLRQRCRCIGRAWR